MIEKEKAKIISLSYIEFLKNKEPFINLHFDIVKMLVLSDDCLRYLENAIIYIQKWNEDPYNTKYNPKDFENYIENIAFATSHFKTRDLLIFKKEESPEFKNAYDDFFKTKLTHLIHH
jgi:hypothetical protein